MRSKWTRGAAGDGLPLTRRPVGRALLTATRGLRPQASDAVEEVVEQALGGLSRLRSPLFGLLQQRIRVDAFRIELMPVCMHPVVHDLRGHLRVELEAEVPPDRSE